MTKPLPSINLKNLVRQVITEQRHSYILESPRTLEEGVYDPAILKAIFTAGGPGSGKSFTADAIFGARGPKGKPYFENASFLGGGLKYINSDRFFEKELEKAGIDPGDLAKIEKEDPELWDKIQGRSPCRTADPFHEQANLVSFLDRSLNPDDVLDERDDPGSDSAT